MLLSQGINREADGLKFNWWYFEQKSAGQKMKKTRRTKKIKEKLLVAAQEGDISTINRYLKDQDEDTVLIDQLIAIASSHEQIETIKQLLFFRNNSKKSETKLWKSIFDHAISNEHISVLKALDQEGHRMSDYTLCVRKEFLNNAALGGDIRVCRHVYKNIKIDHLPAEEKEEFLYMVFEEGCYKGNLDLIKYFENKLPAENVKHLWESNAELLADLAVIGGHFSLVKHALSAIEHVEDLDNILIVLLTSACCHNRHHIARHLVSNCQFTQRTLKHVGIRAETLGYYKITNCLKEALLTCVLKEQ